MHRGGLEALQVDLRHRAEKSTACAGGGLLKIKLVQVHQVGTIPPLAVERRPGPCRDPRQARARPVVRPNLPKHLQGNPLSVAVLDRWHRVRPPRCDGSRLRLAAGRVGGEAGLALACALIDMVEADVDPTGWPITEVIALLCREAARDRQVARLLIELGEIEKRLAVLSMELDDEDVIRRPAA
jgi:hypothetical protein